MSAYPAIDSVLPHRAPMILLDRILDHGGESISCSVRLRDDSPFVENGKVPAIVATEYMAQTVAAFAGLQARRKSDPVQIGYLIGVRRMDLSVAEFAAGDELIVHATRIWDDSALGQFDCSVVAHGDRVVGALLNVFQGDLESIENGPAEPV